MANNNPYPNLDTVLLDVISNKEPTTLTSILTMISVPKSTVIAHLSALCKKGKIKRVYPLSDMRRSFYVRVDET